MRIVIAALSFAAFAGPARAAAPTKAELVNGSTGTITKLGSQIQVGRLSCSVDAKLRRALTGRFDVGEAVSIGCLNRVLQRIKDTPEVSSSTVVGGQLSCVCVTSSATFGPGSVTIQGETAHASGVIESLTPSSITVDGTTCALPPFFEQWLVTTSHFAVGVSVSIACGDAPGGPIGFAASIP